MFDKDSAVQVRRFGPRGIHDLFRDRHGQICLTARSRHPRQRVTLNAEALEDFRDLPERNKYLCFMSGGNPPTHEALIRLEDLPNLEEQEGPRGFYYIVNISDLKKAPVTMDEFKHRPPPPPPRKFRVEWNEGGSTPPFADWPPLRANPSVIALQDWLSEHAPDMTVLITVEGVGVAHIPGDFYAET